MDAETPNVVNNTSENMQVDATVETTTENMQVEVTVETTGVTTNESLNEDGDSNIENSKMEQ
ncbi:hypothetical protein Hanom_Chr16g01419441 [Helianthus anomalus]